MEVVVKPTAKIAVVGAGKLGLLVAKVLEAGGGDVKLLCRSQKSRELPQKWEIPSGFGQDFLDDDYDFVVEATGNIEGFRESLRIVRPMGTIVLKSTFAGEAKIDLTKVVVGEITIVGSRCGPFPAAVRMLSRRQIDVTDMIDGEFELEEALKGIEFAKKPGIRKVLLRM